MPWLTHGISNGRLTTTWPRHPDAYFDTFPAAVAVSRDSEDDPRAVIAAADACPTAAIAVGDDGSIEVDRGRCILCGHCVAIAPGTFQIDGPANTAALDRAQLIEGGIEPTDEQLALLRKRLAQRTRQLRRSVHIRHIDAGSDGAEEWELQALLNPVYDIHRLGIFFTASPRHADILLVTGIGTGGMTEPLARVREAMPDPVVVVGCGTDAISGGLMGSGYTGGHGVGARLDVDVWIPGSPPSPFSILHGILLALDSPLLPTRKARP